MSQKTSQNLTIEPLNDKQLLAIDLLIGGMSVTETALEVRVERETVSRWKNGNAAFIAAYNQARVDTHESYLVSLAELRLKAADYLLSCFDETEKLLDRKTRANVALKLLAMDCPAPYLKTDARDIQAELSQREAAAGLTGIERMLAEGF